MSVLRAVSRLTFIQAVSLCVCVTIASESDQNGFLGERTGNLSSEYMVLPSGAVELPPIKSTYRNLRSGPILILDQVTLYITSLHYDGKLPDVHFLAETSRGRHLLPDENGSLKNLHAYWGGNIYLNLLNITIHDIDYVHVWSKDENNHGSVAIPKNLPIPEKVDLEEDQNGRKIIWIPKCCSIGESVTTAGCNRSVLPFYLTTGFLEMNKTHINNESQPHECAAYKPYVNSITCKNGKIPLYQELDTYVFLQNGSLLYIDGKALLSQDQYCVETIEDEEQTVPFICLPATGYPEAIYYIYASGMLLSCIFFFLTAAIFYTVLEECKIRIKCIIIYCLCMAGSFIVLSSAQLYHVEGETCNALGYILEFLFVLSFGWLAVFSYETQYIISKPPTKRYDKRFRLYCGLTIIVAVALALLTVAMSEIPFLPQQILKPQFGHNSCVFDEKDMKTLFFYIPIFIGILISIGYLIYAKYLIVQKTSTDANPEEKMRIIDHDLKTKFRACWMLVTIATLSWIVEVVSFALNSQSGITIAMDIVESLQGVFVFIIFVLHNPMKNKVLTKLGLIRLKEPTHHQNGTISDEYFERLGQMNELRPLNRLSNES